MDMVELVEGEGGWSGTTVEAACGADVGDREEDPVLEDDSYKDLNSSNSARRATSSDLRVAISALGAERGGGGPGGAFNLGGGEELAWERDCCVKWSNMLF